MTHRRFVAPHWLVVAVAAVLVMGGCASVPSSGPVEQVSPNVPQTQDNGVRIDPEAPRPDATPERVVAGFLSAMASLQPGFSVAKLYLTDAARRQWDPSNGTTIIDSTGQRLIATATSEVLDAPIVGQLSGVGQYQSVTGEFRHDFALTKVGGRWRISSPPQGLVITTTTFASYYVPMERYFLTADGAHVVPETLRVPASDFSPTEAITALLRGPSSWLGPAVSSAAPAGTRLAGGAVTVDISGVAEVNLDLSASSLPDNQRKLLAAQLAWTLKQFSAVQSVQLAARGQPLDVPSLAPHGVMAMSGYLPAPPVDDTPSVLVVSRDRHLGQLDPTSGTFTAFKGGLAKVDAGRITALAAGRSGDLLAWTEGGTVWRGTPDKTTAVYHGASLGRPQVTADGTIWCTDVAHGVPRLVRIASDGSVGVIPLTSQPHGPVTAYAVSPDQTRVALVVGSSDGTSRMGLVSLTSGAHPTTHGWYETRMSASQTGAMALITDVAWSTPSQLVVLAGATSSPRTGAYGVSDDAATITALGPADNAEPLRLVVHARLDSPTVMIVTSAGQVQEIQDAWRWRTVASGIGLAALSD